MARERFGPGRHFGDEQPARGNLFLQFDVLGRVGHVDPAGDDGNGAAALPHRGEGTAVRCCVDPAGKARHDGVAACGQRSGVVPGKAAGSGRGIARADERDGPLP